MIRRSASAAAIVATVLLFGSMAASAASERHLVTTDVITHETTQEIHVWAPASEGAYPVVYAMHGTCDLCGDSWDVVGEALAANGVVVFGVDYHGTDYQVGRYDRMTQELECGYRYAREVAADYGGDLDEPVVFIGHSWGATMALGGGLDDKMLVPGGSYDVCFEGAERPDVIVPIAGCHYEHQGQHFGFDTSALGNGDATVILVGGEDDEECAAWQSVDAAAALAQTGRNATSEVIPGANHMTLIGHDFVDGEWLTIADHPAAARVVQVVLDAINRPDAPPGLTHQPSD